MRKIIVALVFCTGLHLATPGVQAQNVSVSFQLFYDELSPYGMWVNNPDYGYVWVPDVGRSFQPYSSDGYWAYTDAGWTWVSNYPWGWAPFHYGRWYYDNFYGYVWIPGNQWGPAWVNWRHCNGYYGWTPLGPGYGYGYATSYTAYTAPAERWIFVRERDFGRTNINNYYVDRSHNTTIINKSTVINNSIVNQTRNENYIAGPSREQVQKVTGKNINALKISDNAKPGMRIESNAVSTYRPKIETGSKEKAMPARVTSQDDARKVIEKNGTPSFTDKNKTVTNPSQENRGRVNNQKLNNNTPQPKSNLKDANDPGRAKYNNAERKVNQNTNDRRLDIRSTSPPSANPARDRVPVQSQPNMDRPAPNRNFSRPDMPPSNRVPVTPQSPTQNRIPLDRPAQPMQRMGPPAGQPQPMRQPTAPQPSRGGKVPIR